MNQDDDLRTVRRIYEAFIKGDLPTMVALMDDDIELIPPVFAGVTAVPGWGRSWRGRREVEQYLGTLAKALEFEVFQPDEFVVAPQHVVVLGHESNSDSASRIFEYGRVGSWIPWFIPRDMMKEPRSSRMPTTRPLGDE
jgi:ketosteroid isomerase-like protein